MPRARATSTASTASTAAAAATNQELGSMYDYLAKIILLGPSGAGKSCLLHRFIHSHFRALSSQTIGVEFASKIISIGTPPRRTRIKLQLWDTAGTERFRSVSRSYYRGAAGAILVYDVASWRSFEALGEFLGDARALASRDLCVVLAGNKCDVGKLDDGAAAAAAAEAGEGDGRFDIGGMGTTPSAFSSAPGSYTDTPIAAQTSSNNPPSTPSSHKSSTSNLTSNHKSSYTTAPFGPEVPPETASRFASQNRIPVAVEVSALTGEGVDELFHRLASMILTKIELGEIDPDDPGSGIQYGDIGGWGRGWDDEADGGGSVRRRRGRGKAGRAGGQLREWEEVFRLGPGRGGGRCC